MPTGYTDGVQSGKITEFRDFALRCARAMGACIDMRDDAADKPIPVFKPSKYHQECLEEGRQMLEDLQTLTPAQVKERADQDYQLAYIGWQESEERREQIRERYESMLAKVTAWQPPTEEHQGLKRFMQEQLAESIRFDCSHHRNPPVPETPQDWLENQVRQLREDMAYHAQHYADEVRRVTERNRWVRQMCESLGVPAPQESAQ